MAGQKVTGMLRFSGGPVPPSTTHGWMGPWPPPERMGVAVGKQSALCVFFTEDALDEQELALSEIEQAAEVTWYRRDSVSALTDAEAAEMTHVIRGAEYVPE